MSRTTVCRFRKDARRKRGDAQLDSRGGHRLIRWTTRRRDARRQIPLVVAAAILAGERERHAHDQDHAQERDRKAHR